MYKKIGKTGLILKNPSLADRLTVIFHVFADSLKTGSVLYSYVTQMDFLNVNTLVTSLIGG